MVNSGMRQEEEMMLLSSVLASEIHPQMPQGEGRIMRRRRRKAKGDAAGRDSKKRSLSDEQARFLEMSFGEEKKLECGRKVRLAAELGLDPKQVAVWFQNRRARHKSKQVEEAYLELKSAHDATVVEKCRLENEVLKLEDKLLKAQEEIKKLSLGVSGAAAVDDGNMSGKLIGSPGSSTLTYQPLATHFEVVEEEADLMYVLESGFNDYIMDQWAYF